MFKLNCQYLKSLIVLLFLLVSFNVFADSENTQEIRQMLSSRHPAINIDSLLDIAGGEDNLINILSTLRTESKPPFLGINAMRVLFRFTEREDVQTLLLEDVNSSERFGLASFILSRLDDISDPDLRLQIAKSALTKSSTLNSEERSRINLLLQSSQDKKIKNLIQ